ncbi:MAG: hypothetical protein AYK18_17560 [Theionarchaea archaeon DG-70]|nr:MAG: hypothetical protein AYK18_17560 [Theionarchaea archaeon DG-70]
MKVMKVLGIAGSPRKEGNTEILMRTALASAERFGAEVELLRAVDKNVKPCNGCLTCLKTGECVIKDDDMQEIYQKLQAADGIILGSPVYYFSVTAQMKVLIDRMFALYRDQTLANKIGGAIAVASRTGCICTLDFFNRFFAYHNMLVAGMGASGYASKKGDIMKDTRALRESEELGERLIFLIKSIKDSK